MNSYLLSRSRTLFSIRAGVLRSNATTPLTMCIASALLLAGCAGQATKAVNAEYGQAITLNSELEHARGKLRFEAFSGPYFADRYSYPTGQFQSRWLVDAQKQFNAAPQGTPAGAVSQRGSSQLRLPAGQFSLIGPKPMTSTGGGTGIGAVAGRVNTIASHPSDASIAWLGSDGGGIWKTNTCCSTSTAWRPVTDSPSINSIAISDISLDPNNPNTLFATTGDFRFGSFSFGASGVLKSTDGGENWTALAPEVFTPFYPPSANGFPQYQSLSAIRVDPNDSNKVIVGSKTGVYVSYDAGSNWTGPCSVHGFSTQRQDVTDIELRDLGTSTAVLAAIGTRGFATPVQPDLNNNGGNGVYGAAFPSAGCPSFVLKSVPTPGAWPSVTGQGAPQTAVGRIAIAVAPSDPNIVYAQTSIAQSSATVQGYYKSIDGGDNWTTISNINANGCGNANVQSWYNLGIDVSPNNPDFFVSSAVDQFRSTDGGVTQTNITCGYSGGSVHVDNHSRAWVAGQQESLLLGSDGGIWHSAQASTAGSTGFISLNQTLPTIEFYTGDITANFATASSGIIGAVGGAQDNGTSVGTWTGTDRTANAWPLRLGGDGMYARIEPVLAQRWYMSSQNGSIRASTTGPTGAVSTTVSPAAWGSDRKSFITPFEIYKYGADAGANATCSAASNGCGRMIGGTYRVWESITGGIPSTSWYINSPDLTDGAGDPGPALAERAFINQLSHAVSDPSVAVVGTNDGNVWMGFGMGTGAANTASWVKLTGGNTLLPNRPILDVATDPLDPLIAYAAVGGFDQNTPATPGRVFQAVCTAACASFTWRNVSGNLPNIPANSIIGNPNNRKQVFVGTDWGLFFTDDIDASNVVWTRFANGLPNVMVWDLAIDRGFTTLAAFTRSRGAWAMPLPLPSDPDVMLKNGFE